MSSDLVQGDENRGTRPIKDPTARALFQEEGRYEGGIPLKSSSPLTTITNFPRTNDNATSGRVSHLKNWLSDFEKQNKEKNKVKKPPTYTKKRITQSTPQTKDFISIPMNKVDTMRKVLFEFEHNNSNQNNKMTPSKERAVIEDRMSKVAEIRKWLNEMEKQKQGSQKKNTKSAKELNLPMNRVSDMKNWLVELERQNQEHFKKHNTKGLRLPGSNDTFVHATSRHSSVREARTNESEKESKGFEIDVCSTSGVSELASWLTDLERKNKERYERSQIKRPQREKASLPKSLESSLIAGENATMESNPSLVVENTQLLAQKPEMNDSNISMMPVGYDEEDAPAGYHEEDINFTLWQESDIDVSRIESNEDCINIAPIDSNEEEDLSADLIENIKKMSENVPEEKTNEACVSGDIEITIMSDDGKDEVDKDILTLSETKLNDEKDSKVFAKEEEPSSSTEENEPQVERQEDLGGNLLNANDRKESTSSSPLLGEGFTSFRSEVVGAGSTDNVLVYNRVNKNTEEDKNDVQVSEKKKSRSSIVRVLKSFKKIFHHKPSHSKKQEHQPNQECIDECQEETSNADQSQDSTNEESSDNSWDEDKEKPLSPDEKSLDYSFDSQHKSSYLPASYGHKPLLLQDDSSNNGMGLSEPVTPSSVASAFMRGLSPDSSTASTIDFATELNEVEHQPGTRNVSQHVNWLKGVFGSPMRNGAKTNSPYKIYNLYG